MKDANWDPNFPETAKRAEWFLEKELELTTNGVIAIAGNTISELLSFDKPSALTTRDKRLLLILLFEKLTSKDMLIYFENSDAQKVISSFNWSGEVAPEVCTGNCFSEITGLVEASDSDSQGSKKIKRIAELLVVFEDEIITNKLTVTLTNESNEKYKTYLRVLADKNSNFGPIKINTKENSELVEPEIEEKILRKEAGVFMEIEAGEAMQAQFGWKRRSKLSFTQSGNYLLKFYKQPGIEEFGLQIKYGFPKDLVFTTKPSFSLTTDGLFGYNTALTRDFISRVSW